MIERSFVACGRVESDGSRRMALRDMLWGMEELERSVGAGIYDTFLD